MKNSLFTLLAFLILGLPATYAQDILLDEFPFDDDSRESRFGPNRRFYMHSYYYLGPIVGPHEGLSHQEGASKESGLGTRYKIRIASFFSFGFDLNFRYTSLRFPAGELNPAVDTLFTQDVRTHLKSKLAWQGLGLGAYIRFNLDPWRGDILGAYIDVGAGPDIIVGKSFLLKDKQANSTRVKTRYNRFPYLNGHAYTAYAWIGYNSFGLGFSYRISDVFKEKYGMPEPPRFAVSLQLNIPKF